MLIVSNVRYSLTSVLNVQMVSLPIPKTSACAKEENSQLLTMFFAETAFLDVKFVPTKQHVYHARPDIFQTRTGLNVCWTALLDCIMLDQNVKSVRLDAKVALHYLTVETVWLDIIYILVLVGKLVQQVPLLIQARSVLLVVKLVKHVQEAQQHALIVQMVWYPTMEIV